MIGDGLHKDASGNYVKSTDSKTDSVEFTTTVPQQSAVPATSPVAPLAPITGNVALDTLIQIMLKREARIAEQEEKVEESKRSKAAQRRRNAESNFDDDKERQSRCKHLKGGKNRLRTQVKDFAVYLHRFINNEQVIRCTLCGAKWKVRDTKEFLYRYGKRVENWTGIGWVEALAMVSESSNKPSSSEVPMAAQPAAPSSIIEN
jgi:hypothetical protein